MTEPIAVRGMRGKLAVHIPLPRFDGTQHCVGQEMYPEDADNFPSAQAASTAAFYFYRQQRQVCEDCPFRVECAEYAIAHEFDGMWGGLTPKQRMLARRERGWMLTAPEEVYDRLYSHNTTQDEEDVA